MNQAVSLEKFAKEFKSRFENLSMWVEKNYPGEGLDCNYGRKMHPRLESFCRYYKYYVGANYEPQNHPAEGGAAKRTELFLNHYQYREAIQTYMTQISEDVLLHSNYLDFIKWAKSYIPPQESPTRREL